MKRIRIIALILALVMTAFALAACGNEGGNKPHPVEPDSSVDSGSDNGGEPDSGSENGTEPDSGSETESGPDNTDATGVAAEALRLANDLIGTEYKSGGTGPDEFDNSGFIYYIFRQSGYKMPRRIPEMANEGTEVGRNDIQAGDVLIFSNEIDGEAAFVAICAGGDQFISCNRPGYPTALQSFSGYYEQRFICGRRIG